MGNLDLRGVLPQRQEVNLGLGDGLEEGLLISMSNYLRGSL